MKMLAFLTCRDEAEILGKHQVKDEIISINFHSQTSMSQPSYAIAIPKSSFAAKLISRSKVFALNFLPERYGPQFSFCMGHSGEHLDKFKETGFLPVEAEKIDCARIKQAEGFIECEVLQEIDVNDYVLMIAKVLNYKSSQNFEVIRHG